MLKIKDNVDLKELEKFGFVKSHTKLGEYVKTIQVNYDDVYNLIVDENSKQIFIEHDLGKKELKNIDILFDLIQAGLVEKVEG